VVFIENFLGIAQLAVDLPADNWSDEFSMAIGGLKNGEALIAFSQEKTHKSTHLHPLNGCG
jgi:hypothetical protein